MSGYAPDTLHLIMAWRNAVPSKKLEWREYMKEIWKDVEGYEGFYQISNFGRVKSLPRTVKRQNNSDLHIAGRILKLGTYPNKYKYARLHKNGKTKNALVHRLVAIAFIKNDKKFPIINHKDESRDNNRVDNLEWCNHKYNSNYGTCKERMTANTDIQKRAEKHKKKVLQLDVSGNLIKEWSSITDADVVVGGGKKSGNIGKCAKGKLKTAYGYIWKLANQ